MKDEIPTSRRWASWRQPLIGIFMRLAIFVVVSGSITLLIYQQPNWFGHRKEKLCIPVSRRPLRIGITAWAGFAGGLLANGGFYPSHWTNKTTGIEFVFLDG